MDTFNNVVVIPDFSTNLRDLTTRQASVVDLDDLVDKFFLNT